MTKSTYDDFSLPVYQSLIEEKRFLGIGGTATYFIFMITILMITFITIYSFILSMVAFLILRTLCKDEPFLVDFLLENLSQANRYEG